MVLNYNILSFIVHRFRWRRILNQNNKLWKLIIDCIYYNQLEILKIGKRINNLISYFHPFQTLKIFVRVIR